MLRGWKKSRPWWLPCGAIKKPGFLEKSGFCAEWLSPIRALVAQRAALGAAIRRRAQHARRFIAVGHLENAVHLAVTAARAAIGVLDADVLGGEHLAHVGQGARLIAQLDQQHIRL